MHGPAGEGPVDGAGTCAPPAVVTHEAARRRSDARLFLIALAFFSAAVFSAAVVLGLHAAATPGYCWSGE